MKRIVHPIEQWFEPILRGDTWDGLETLKIRVDDEVPEVALADVEIKFREYSGAPDVGFSASTSEGTILLVDAADWHVSILPILNLNVKPADWIGDVRTTDANGNRRSYLRLVQPIRETTNR